MSALKLLADLLICFELKQEYFQQPLVVTWCATTHIMRRPLMLSIRTRIHGGTEGSVQRQMACC